MALALLLFTSGGQDDSYITYWPARALADYGEILNYNGDRLEQSSSLALVVVLAAAYKLTPLSMPTVGYLTSMLLGALTLVLATQVARRAGVARPWLVAPAVGTVTSFLYWSTSGMETTLVTAAGLWVVLEFERGYREGEARWSAPLACLLLAASRPEAPLVLGAVVAGLAAAAAAAWRAGGEGRSALRGLALAAGSALAAVLPLLAFRRVYFGAWVPNPAAMKSDGFNATEGALYAWDAFFASGPHLLGLFALAACAAAARAARGRALPPLGAMVVCLAAAHLGFAVLSGGDWMHGGRFLAPAVPALVLSAFLLGADALETPSGVTAAAAAVVAANVLGALQMVHHGGAEGRPLWTALRLPTRLRRELVARGFAPIELGNKLHLRDAVTIDRMLAALAPIEAQSKGPVWVMTGQAGMMGYHLMSRYFGRVRLLDLWSLTGRELRSCLPPGAARGSKWGTFIGLDEAFSMLERDGARCGLARPQVYYNECLTDEARKILEKHGYVVLYNQVGTVHNARSEELYPDQTAACGHFAVQKELVDALGLASEPTRQWSIIPPLAQRRRPQHGARGHHRARGPASPAPLVALVGPRDHMTMALGALKQAKGQLEGDAGGRRQLAGGEGFVGVVEQKQQTLVDRQGTRHQTTFARQGRRKERRQTRA